VYGERWARLKRRFTCSHSYIWIEDEQVLDLDTNALGNAFTARRRTVSVYRCELCGKKRRESDYGG